MIAMMMPPWTTNPTREPSGTFLIVSANASQQRVLKSVTLSPSGMGVRHIASTHA